MLIQINGNNIDDVSDDELLTASMLVYNEFVTRWKRKEVQASRISPILVNSTPSIKDAPIIQDNSESPTNKPKDMKAYKRWYYLKPRVAAGQAKQEHIAEFAKLDAIFGK